MPAFADVIFPQKLPPLTYRVPEDAPPDIVGCVVRAGLGRRMTSGLVVARYDSRDAAEQVHGKLPAVASIKSIESIGSRFWSPSGIRLVQWLADYYLVPAGLALKSCFFEDALAQAGALRKQRSKYPALDSRDMALLSAGELAGMQKICEAVREDAYRAFLYHAPLESGPREFIQELLRTSLPLMNGILVLVPEMHALEYYSAFLQGIAGDRLALLHSRMSPNRRLHAVRRIHSGEADIVLGTRSAVLAPLASPSLIVVVDEHSSSLKAEEGLHYHGRDVAVMRAYLEKACVVLASSCPSVESAYNAQVGKYRLLDHQKTKRGAERRAEIRIVPPPPRKAHSRQHLSPEIVRTMRGYLKAGENVLFLINRKGYSLLQCRDCGEIVRCESCSNPMVFHKAAGKLDCRLCMAKSGVPEYCPSCSGLKLDAVGAGTERIRDEIQELLGEEAGILQKDGGETADALLFSEMAPIVVGTEYAVRSGAKQQYAAAVVLSIDATLSQPDFRAHERTFQDIVQVLHSLRPGGTLFIQTRNSREPLVRSIARLDYNSFIAHELEQRKLLNYPPYSRMVRLSVHHAGNGKIVQRLDALLKEPLKGTPEILGPLELPSELKGFSACWQILLKTADRKASGDVVRRIQKMFDRDRHVRVVADVDPYWI